MAAFTVFADESGTHASYDCYGIGALVVPTLKLSGFNSYLRRKRLAHGLTSEAKWDQIRNGHGMINFALELLQDLLRSSARFSIIVVHKGAYRNWQENNEAAFYQTYTMLMTHRASVRPGEYEIFIDDRSDGYDKQTEVMELVSNHLLRRLPTATSEVTRVAKVDSKLEFGIQAADLLTGAITAAHNMHLKPAFHVNAGKDLLLKKLSATLGWEALHFDTKPDSKFNIWHFPKETWRAKPATREIVPDYTVPLVTPDELVAALKNWR